MPNNNFEIKHPRGSSPPYQRLEQEYKKWVSQLPLIKQTQAGAQREDPKNESTSKTSDHTLQSADEGRWQDDGGEGG
jgi:hypothetical protein